jgi:hypothetical protein
VFVLATAATVLRSILGHVAHGVVVPSPFPRSPSTLGVIAPPDARNPRTPTRFASQHYDDGEKAERYERVTSGHLDHLCPTGREVALLEER